MSPRGVGDLSGGGPRRAAAQRYFPLWDHSPPKLTNDFVSRFYGPGWVTPGDEQRTKLRKGLHEDVDAALGFPRSADRIWSEFLREKLVVDDSVPRRMIVHKGSRRIATDFVNPRDSKNSRTTNSTGWSTANSTMRSSP